MSDTRDQQDEDLFLYREGLTVRMYLRNSPLSENDSFIAGPFSLPKNSKIIVFIIPVASPLPRANKEFNPSSFKGLGPFSESGAKKLAKDQGWILAAKSCGGDHYLKPISSKN